MIIEQPFCVSRWWS